MRGHLLKSAYTKLAEAAKLLATAGEESLAEEVNNLVSPPGIQRSTVEKPKDNDNSCDQSRHNERVEKHLLPANAIHGKRRRLSASMAERDAQTESLLSESGGRPFQRLRNHLYGSFVF